VQLTAFDNPYVERIVGSIRRECLDHVIIFGERHLRRVSSARIVPPPGPIQPPSVGEIVTFPEVDGLHHRYERRAA
jgi:putative transposase